MSANIVCDCPDWMISRTEEASSSHDLDSDSDVIKSSEALCISESKRLWLLATRETIHRIRIWNDIEFWAGRNQNGVARRAGDTWNDRQGPSTTPKKLGNSRLKLSHPLRPIQSFPSLLLNLHLSKPNVSQKAQKSSQRNGRMAYYARRIRNISQYNYWSNSPHLQTWG